MRDLGTCPHERPFWCAHPHCLYCNWHDDRDGDASAFAAHLGDTTPHERRQDRRWPESDYVENRRYIGWLCVECANDSRIIRWFLETVVDAYPDATLVSRPGTRDETSARLG